VPSKSQTRWKSGKLKLHAGQCFIFANL